jgi:hypothetical protein
MARNGNHAVESEQVGWNDPRRWVIVGVLAILLVVGLSTFRFQQRDPEANAKADQLTAMLQAGGLPVPHDRDSITRVLGTDGGPVCDDPGSALRKAMLDGQLVNGAASVGQRPIRAEVNLVRGELLVLQVYCPDQLDQARARIHDYVFDHVSKG